MKIMITGVHGFVGTNLTKTLKNGNSIYGIDIVSPVQEGVMQTYPWSDVENGTLPEVDVIIHLAGKAHDTMNQINEEHYFDINVGLTQRIYDYFLKSTAKKFIFFSSVKAVAETVRGGMLTEEVIPAPKDIYGRSKRLAEQYLQENGPAVDSGKRVYILRPCMIHGPGSKGNLTMLYKIVQKGIPWPLGAFNNQRSFTSIDNLSFVIERILGCDVPSGIFQMADDEPLSTNELIRMMCETLGQKPRIWYLPKGLMEITAQVSGILHLPLNPDRLRKLTENYVVSNAKIKNALGIEGMPVKASEGLRRTLLSFIK